MVIQQLALRVESTRVRLLQAPISQVLLTMLPHKATARAITMVAVRSITHLLMAKVKSMAVLRHPLATDSLQQDNMATQIRQSTTSMVSTHRTNNIILADMHNLKVQPIRMINMDSNMLDIIQVDMVVKRLCIKAHINMAHPLAVMEEAMDKVAMDNKAAMVDLVNRGIKTALLHRLSDLQPRPCPH